MRRSAFFASKRILDILLAGLGLLLLAPLLVAVAIAIRLGESGAVLFRQQRMGRGSKPFFMLKFRTMVEDAHRAGPLVTAAGDARVTPLGRLLRMTKLDELPQLWNVLKGDMSLVGPRPQTPQYFELYRDEYAKILAVTRPGITDFAAIHYRDEEGVLARLGDDPEAAYIRWVIPRKLRLYRLYVQRMSFLTDLYILYQTAGVLVSRRKQFRRIDSGLGPAALPPDRSTPAGP